MKCNACKGNIASGVEAKKAIIEYQQPDGTTKIFGYMMPDGPLSQATGRIVRAWHNKHFHVVRKREAKGDAVHGRVLSGAPTGYTEADTEAMGANLDALRAVAARIGKAIGDPEVTEAYRAQCHGGPYPHSHHLPLETYQLIAHLRHAHGFTHPAGAFEADGAPQSVHARLHAAAALAATTAARAADPDHTEPAERDWREQVAIDITELDARTHP